MGASPYCKSQRVYGTHENHTEPSWDVTDHPPKTHNYDHKHDEGEGGPNCVADVSVLSLLPASSRMGSDITSS
jgi:hypothetical protein